MKNIFILIFTVAMTSLYAQNNGDLASSSLGIKADNSSTLVSCGTATVTSVFINLPGEENLEYNAERLRPIWKVSLPSLLDASEAQVSLISDSGQATVFSEPEIVNGDVSVKMRGIIGYTKSVKMIISNIKFNEPKGRGGSQATTIGHSLSYDASGVGSADDDYTNDDGSLSITVYKDVAPSISAAFSCGSVPQLTSQYEILSEYAAFESISWEGPSGYNKSTKDASDLKFQGDYVVTVIDNQGCKTKDTVSVDCPSLPQSAPLSVQLMSFSAKASQKNSILKWSAFKTNDSDFYVERSHDGINFERIGILRGKDSKDNYTYVDNNPNTINYYRLHIVSEGKSAHSRVEMVTFQDDNVMVYPNPFIQQVSLSSGSYLGEIHVVVTDVDGRLIYRTITEERTLDLGDLKSGVYTLTVKDGHDNVILHDRIVKIQ